MSLLTTYNTFPSFKVFRKEIRPIEHKGGKTNPSKKQQILRDPQEELYLQVYLVENGVSSNILSFILTAFLPCIRQELQVLHSMHCHRNLFTFEVSSGENFRHDGCPSEAIENAG